MNYVANPMGALWSMFRICEPVSVRYSDQAHMYLTGCVTLPAAVYQRIPQAKSISDERQKDRLDPLLNLPQSISVATKTPKVLWRRLQCWTFWNVCLYDLHQKRVLKYGSKPISAGCGLGSNDMQHNSRVTNCIPSYGRVDWYISFVLKYIVVNYLTH